MRCPLGAKEHNKEHNQQHLQMAKRAASIDLGSMFCSPASPLHPPNRHIYA